MKKTFRSRKYVTMLALVLALAVAVYLNWRFTQIDQSAQMPDDAQIAAAESSTGQTTNYGDAMFVSNGSSDAGEYFAEVRLDRAQSRDEALDALQEALSNTELSDAEKTALTAQLTAVAQSISLEADIEALIKSKGFSDCVAFISDGSIKILVPAPESGLTTAQVAQITEIVLSQTDIPAENISIVEVK